MGFGLKVCPDASRKFWGFIGCRKLTYHQIFGFLSCTAFQSFMPLWGQKWTVWPWESIFFQNDFKIPFWLTWFKKDWLQSRLGSILLKHRPTLKWSLRRRWVQNKKIKPSGLWGTVTHIVSNLIYHTYLESSGQWVCPFIFCHPGLFRVLKKVEKYFYQRDPGVPM